MKIFFLQLPAVILLAGCLQSEPPRQVIDAYATAPRQPITVFAYDADVPFSAAAARNHPRSRLTGGGSFSPSPRGLNAKMIPPPWFPTTPQNPWFYQNNFYYQWNTYRQSYFPSHTGPFDTRYDRHWQRQQYPIVPLRRTLTRPPGMLR